MSAYQSYPPAESAPSRSQSAPYVAGMFGHGLTLQAVMDLKESIAKLDAKVDGLNTAVSVKFDALSATINDMDVRTHASLQTTQSKIDGLLTFKNMIVGGAIVLGAVVAILGWGWVEVGKPLMQGYEIRPRAVTQEQHPPSINTK